MRCRVAGDDLVKGGAGASATDVFGTVPKEPVREKEPVPIAPGAQPEPAMSASSGGFTQLLRALNYDQVKHTAKEAPAATESKKPETAEGSAAGGGGPMTQLLRTIGGQPGETGQSAVEKLPVPVVSAQVTSFLPQNVQVASAIPAPVPTAPEAGSFTQLFQRLESEPISEPISEPVKEIAPEKPVVAPPPLERVEPVPPSSGSFTQLFAAVDAGAAPAVEAAPVPAAGSPGSFTQMFQAVGTPPADEARYVPPPPVVEAPKQAAATTPGSFTQMFRTLDEEPKPQEPASDPGSFTQMFEGAAPPSTPVVPPPPSSYERPFVASKPRPEESGASQMFATYREPQPVPVDRGPAFSPVEAAPAGRPLPSSTPSSGGLTQLLRALDQPAQTPKPYVAPSYPPPVAAAPQPGSFTGAYGELGAPVAAASAPVAPSATPQAAAAPSEFTRLINASAMREAALRGGGGPVSTPPGAPAAAPAAGGAGFAMPGGLSAVPHASFSSPAAPAISISGPGGTHAAVSAAGGGHASFAAPHLPPVPALAAAKLPELPKAAGAPAGLQKYVPLLLILVIFLLLAILVAVVVLMKK